MSVRTFFLVVFALLAGGCIGFFFGPGFSCRDTAYFQEVPVIVKRGDTYALRWTFGTWGFFFRPEYKVREGALWFSLQGTSSSGHMTGQTMELEIKGEKAVAALQAGGAYWWEPDRTTVRLQVVEKTPEPVGIGRHESDGETRPDASRRP